MSSSQMSGLGGFVPLGSITEEYYDKTFDTNGQGVALHSPEGAPDSERWRFHHSDRFSRGRQRHPELRRLRREQSGYSLIRCEPGPPN